jgi:hypothetical protein
MTTPVQILKEDEAKVGGEVKSIQKGNLISNVRTDKHEITLLYTDANPAI